ncbi:MAG TPA: DUF523 domain-containing protein, partial [Fredinandcohnia sp.]|nr:DUF523 domain-containing protein [Fredinandcohnia sp.]
RRWLAEGRVVPLCPEVAGGLPVPRPPAEIQGGDGRDVLAGRARVATREGDVTAFFLAGAEAALAAARAHGVVAAVLKERSPSCGVRQVYDGSFSGQRRSGMGVTAARLEAAGIPVFSEAELDRVRALLDET